MPADAVTAGTLLAVLPGDRMPVDGIVVSGRATVDESALTGEPLPITKTAGGRLRLATIVSLVDGLMDEWMGFNISGC